MGDREYIGGNLVVNGVPNLSDIGYFGLTRNGIV